MKLVDILRLIEQDEQNNAPVNNKQYQIKGKLVTNTKMKPQTDILSAIRSLPGVTIVNSASGTETADADNKLRYEAIIDVKVDTHSLGPNLKGDIKSIIEQIKNIDGVVDFTVVPIAKETKPY
jgi:nitrate reductase NapAB chaperone NapD